MKEKTDGIEILFQGLANKSKIVFKNGIQKQAMVRRSANMNAWAKSKINQRQNKDKTRITIQGHKGLVSSGTYTPNIVLLTECGTEVFIYCVQLIASRCVYLEIR